MDKQELIAKWEKVAAEDKWIWGDTVAYQQGYQHAARAFVADLLSLKCENKTRGEP